MVNLRRRSTYVKQPEGFITEGKEHLGYANLRKAFMASSSYPIAGTQHYTINVNKWVLRSQHVILAHKDAGGDVFYIRVYVDDIIIAAQNDKQIKMLFLRSTI